MGIERIINLFRHLSANKSQKNKFFYLNKITTLMITEEIKQFAYKNRQ
jgi:hypothetical protein